MPPAVQSVSVGLPDRSAAEATRSTSNTRVAMMKRGAGRKRALESASRNSVAARTSSARANGQSVNSAAVSKP